MRKKKQDWNSGALENSRVKHHNAGVYISLYLLAINFQCENRLDKNTSMPKHICDGKNALRNQRRKNNTTEDRKREITEQFGQS